MLREGTIQKLLPRMNNAIHEILTLSALLEKKKNDIIVWLENGYYEPSLDTCCIGPGMDGFNDFDRNRYTASYLRDDYENRIGNASDRDEKSRLREKSIREELCIYLDFWESAPTLRVLRNLTNILTMNDYDWHLLINKDNKSAIIREEIRDTLIGLGLDLGTIIQEAYHTQIRNAAAHRDFTIRENSLVLTNYDENAYCNLRQLSVDEWEHRFALTFLLNSELLRMRGELRTVLAKDQSTWNIAVPSRTGGFRLMRLCYNNSISRFDLST